MKKDRISIIILTQNEEELIGACIDSVAKINPDEILVIDDNSSDNTVTIAKKKGARVILHQKKNFAEARNFGMQKATSTWLLYIDADEQLSTKLAAKIKDIITLDLPASAYVLTRVNYYLGKEWPKKETMLRLFHKDVLKEWVGALHETANITSELVKKIDEPLFHYTHRSISEMVANTNTWSVIEAKLRYEANHPPIVWWRLPRVMLPVFFDYYINQQGYKLGNIGLIESIYQSFSIFITYAKLWELQRNVRNK